MSRAHVELDAAAYVIKYLFSPREAETLGELLGRVVETEAAVMPRATATADTTGDATPPSPPQQAEVAATQEGTEVVMYSTLLELLLDFQLQRHLVKEKQGGGGLASWPHDDGKFVRMSLRSPKGRTLSPGRIRAAN